MTDSIYLEELPDAVVVVGHDGVVTYVNRATERLAKVGGDQLRNRRHDDVLP